MTTETEKKKQETGVYGIAMINKTKALEIKLP